VAFAFDFVAKPFKTARLLAAIEQPASTAPRG
jgi:hypothetical protein